MTNAQIAGSILLAAVVIPMTVEIVRCIGRGLLDWLDDRIDRMVIDGLATMAEEDAAWDREIDQAIALTVPLHESEVAARIAAIIAFNEAARHDPDTFDWTSPARRVE